MIDVTYEARRKYLLDNTPTDRIIETYDCWAYSEYVISAGGDVTVYRVYGEPTGGFKIGIK